MPKFSTETKIFVAIIAATVLLIGGAAVLFGNGGSSVSSVTTVDQSILVRSDSHFLGPVDAKVTIVEFSDFQCPACVTEDPTVKQMIQKYPQAKFVYREFPLPGHPYGRLTAQAAEAAGLQGKFWEMHDLLFQNAIAIEGASNEQSVRETVIQYAKNLGLDPTKFAADLNSDTVNQKITADQADGNRVNLLVTPTFFINGAKFDGGLTPDQFSKEIDSRLK